MHCTVKIAFSRIIVASIFWLYSLTFGRQDLAFSALRMKKQWTVVSGNILSTWMESRYRTSIHHHHIT